MFVARSLELADEDVQIVLIGPKTSDTGSQDLFAMSEDNIG